MNTELSLNPDYEMSDAAFTVPAVNWLRVGWFLALAFGLAWLVDLVIFLNGGLNQPGLLLSLQFEMLLPAFSAMLLNTFFFKDSPIFYRSNRGSSRWFIYYYFLLTGLYLCGSVAGVLKPDLTPTITSLLAIPL